jgi:hypothetical protein
VRKEEVLFRVKEQGNILYEISKLKANILCRNCSLRQVIKRKLKGWIEVTWIRGRRRRKLLDELKEGRWYSHLKEEALHCTMWTVRFGRGFGPVVRQTTKWMNEWGVGLVVRQSTKWMNKYQKIYNLELSKMIINPVLWEYFHIYSVYKMFRPTSRMASARQNTERSSYKHIYGNQCFFSLIERL